ncbi:MAG: GGDEF domain-containing protein [Oligoflexus sp.]
MIPVKAQDNLENPDEKTEVEALKQEIHELQIRESRAVNDRTNIQYLLYTTRELTAIKSLQEMIPLVLERLACTFKSWSFALIIESSSRPSIIEYMGFEGMTEEEKRLIVKNHHRISNDISVSKDQDDNVTFLDDDEDEFMFSVPAKDEKETQAYKYIEGDIIYGGDIKQVTELLGSGGESEQWIVMPGNIGEDDELKVFVRAYPIDTEQLSTIRLFLSLVSALIHNHLLQNKLEKLANTDALTGLLNRGGLDAAMEQHIYMAKDTGGFVFSIIAIDVNGLKYVNDTFGHEAGDHLITKVAEILRLSTRKTDIISRSGGDEFTVLCPDTDCERTKPIITRIRDYENSTQLSFTHKETGATEMVEVHVSLGVADSGEFPPDSVHREADYRESLDKQEYYKTRKKYR